MLYLFLTLSANVPLRKLQPRKPEIPPPFAVYQHAPTARLAAYLGARDDIGVVIGEQRKGGLGAVFAHLGDGYYGVATVEVVAPVAIAFRSDIAHIVVVDKIKAVAHRGHGVGGIHAFVVHRFLALGYAGRPFDFAVGPHVHYYDVVIKIKIIVAQGAVPIAVDAFAHEILLGHQHGAAVTAQDKLVEVVAIELGGTVFVAALFRFAGALAGALSHIFGEEIEVEGFGGRLQHFFGEGVKAQIIGALDAVIVFFGKETRAHQVAFALGAEGEVGDEFVFEVHAHLLHILPLLTISDDRILIRGSALAARPRAVLVDHAEQVHIAVVVNSVFFYREVVVAVGQGYVFLP